MPEIFKALIELPTSLVWVSYPSDHGDLNQGVNGLDDVLMLLVSVPFVTISTMILVIIGVSLRKIIMKQGGILMTMQPTIVLVCFNLVACFSGHVDALGRSVYSRVRFFTHNCSL
jgi:hypothetical protein